jgi:hypothetical protein
MPVSLFLFGEAAVFTCAPVVGIDIAVVVSYPKLPKAAGWLEHCLPTWLHRCCVPAAVLVCLYKRGIEIRDILCGMTVQPAGTTHGLLFVMERMPQEQLLTRLTQCEPCMKTSCVVLSHVACHDHHVVVAECQVRLRWEVWVIFIAEL